jgi:hypothetical protein
MYGNVNVNRPFDFSNAAAGKMNPLLHQKNTALPKFFSAEHQKDISSINRPLTSIKTPLVRS